MTVREGSHHRYRLRRRSVWTITWIGVAGAASAGPHYESRAAAERMARRCGAGDIEIHEAEVAA